jgi:hypothetical protein
MKVRSLLVLGAFALAVSVGTSAQAVIIIKTNDGQGADAEVREENTNAQLDENFVNVLKGTNRGSAIELATRGNNTTNTATGDTSSIMYMKFDISSLPGSADPFWTNKQVRLRLNVNLANISAARLYDVKPNGQGFATNDPTRKIYKDYVRMQFDVRGLEPGNVYADDVGGTDQKTDSFGNPYTANHYDYNWTEGTENGNSVANPNGITFYNAPGLTPHCISSDFGCSTSQSIGLVNDNWNSDARFLGDWEWPQVAPANHLAVGQPLDFTDENLKQLLLDAKDAGRSTVTIMVSHGLDTQNVAATAGIPADSPLLVTPANMLAFNFNTIPKERLVLADDPSYDPDGNNPPLPAPPNNPPTGSPWSCDGTAPNPNSPNCPGSLLGDNSAGFFSPKLMIIPEPASAALVLFGALVASAFAGRRRK